MSKYQSKPGTIGRKIEKLVNSCKSNPMNFYVLQAALEQASQVPNAIVTVNGMCVSQTPGYKAADAELEAILKRCGV